MDIKCGVECADGIWEIEIRGDELQIVDPKGRQRHRSKGHINTGVHLAMQLARHPLTSGDNLDKALNYAAEEFRKGG